MTGASDVSTQVTRGGEASDEEVAAMTAAIIAVWPRPDAGPRRQEVSRWRFSGRWWTKPVPLPRNRPW